MKTKGTHGGARPGAGRPVNEIEKTVCRFRLTEDEHEKVKEYIRVMRMPALRDLPPSGAPID